MFKLNQIYEVNPTGLKSDFMRISSAEVSTINNPNSQKIINIPRKDSIYSLLNSYLDLNFEVIEKVDDNIYGVDNDTRIVKLGPIVFYSKFNLTT